MSYNDLIRKRFWCCKQVENSTWTDNKNQFQLILFYYAFHRLKTTEQMQHSEGVSMGGNFQP